MSFAKRLAELRKGKNMSQKELAEQLKISRSALSLYEIGKREPDYETTKRIADFFGVTIDKLIAGRNLVDIYLEKQNFIPVGETVKIPVLGVIRAGEPIIAEEHIVGYEDISANLVNTGEFFFLRVTGDSMINSRIFDGDLVLVKKQPEVESGQIAVVLINGEEATLKRVYYNSDSLILQPDNPKYAPKSFSAREVKELPVEIIGKVIELRVKF